MSTSTGPTMRMGSGHFSTAACRLKELRKPDHVRILFAVSADKDHQRMLREIAERLKPDLWILSKMESHRTLSVEDLEAAAEKLRAEYGEETEYRVSRDVKHAVKELLGLHGERDLFAYRGVTVSCGGSKGTDQQKHKLTGPFRYAANKAEQGTAELINRAFSGAD